MRRAVTNDDLNGWSCACHDMGTSEYHATTDLENRFVWFVLLMLYCYTGLTGHQRGQYSSVLEINFLL